MSNNRTEQFDMKVALDAAYAKIESLIEEKREMQKRISEFEIREKEQESSNTEIAIAYQKACNKIDALEKEVSDLKTVLQLTIDKDDLKTRKIFGSSSEKMSNLINNSTASEILDEDENETSSWRVIMDGRPAGSKSFIWLHTTSELCECNPIIIFAYEMTRGTDHLRKFYEDFAGVIVCDAYCSYHVLQKEKEEIIIICGCMMHLRRRFAESLALMDIKNVPDEQLDELVEVKALKLIGEIYDADEALKDLSPEERTERRNTEVRPRVKAFYDYIESLDANDPSLSARCRDAISYSLNQKEYIVRFLEDGHIPLDNGFAERCIKPVALLRNASLFSFSIQGAESSMIVHSLMETAKANGADGYWYIRYLFEFLPSKLDQKDRSFLSATTPWSEEYKAYEAANRHKVESYRDYDDLAEKPKTPRKKDRVNIA